MLAKIEQLLQEVKGLTAQNPEELEALRIKYLSKKGAINALMADFRNVPAEQKKEVGMKLNELKNLAQERIATLKEAFDNQDNGAAELDLTRTAYPVNLGTRHPLAIVRNEIIDIFSRMGFTIADGPEVEDDWHVFSSMNFAEDHPARDMQDTFFIESHPDIILRTHTSSVQSRVMEVSQPPIRVICPGRVYRNETTDSHHERAFFQYEALIVDKDIKFTDGKVMIQSILSKVFGRDVPVRMRSGFFPFVEPGFEIDMQCQVCGGKGCSVCKHVGWIEVMPGGSPHPNVLRAAGLDPDEYTGFAFGVGLERIALLKYEIDDMRLLYENDSRFLKQF